MKPLNYLYKNIQLLVSILLFSSIQFLFSQNVSMDFVAHIGGIGDQYGTAMVVDQAGNILSTGDLTGTADFDPGSGVHNLSGLNAFFVSKLDAQGNFLWAHSFEGGFDGNRGLDITTDHHGNVYVTGRATHETDFDPGPDTFYIEEPVNLFGTCFILKLNPLGEFMWAGLVGSDFNACSGEAIEVDIEGNVYIAGDFNGACDFDPDTSTFLLSADPSSPTNEDAFVLKLDPLGRFIWAKQIGGPGRELIRGMKLDHEGNIHVTGSFTETADFDPSPNQFDLTAQELADVFVCKLDSGGQFVWAKPFGSPGSDLGEAIVVGSDGAVTISCLFKGKLDADPGPDSLLFMTTGSNNSLIIQLDSSGNLAWASQLESAPFNHCHELTVDEAGNIYGSGIFTGMTDFDPGALSHPLSPENGSAIFLLKLNAQGQFVWVDALAQSIHAIVQDICLSPGGDFLSIVRFSGTLDTDPGPALNQIMSPDIIDVDFYILKLSQSSTGIEDELEQDSFTVFPNPTNDILSANIQLPIEDIQIFDLQGRLVYRDNYFPISLRSLKSGIYTIQVRTQEKKYIGKFMISD